MVDRNLCRAACCAEAVQVSPAATWARRQHRVQWQLPPLAPGDAGDLKVYFEADASGDLKRAAAAAAAGEDDSAIRYGGLTAAAVEEAVVRCLSPSFEIDCLFGNCSRLVFNFDRQTELMARWDTFWQLSRLEPRLP